MAALASEGSPVREALGALLRMFIDVVAGGETGGETGGEVGGEIDPARVREIVDKLAACHLGLLAAATRYQMGRRLGAAGEAMRREADAYLLRERVVRPEALVRIFAPV